MNGTGRLLPTSLGFFSDTDKIFVCGQNDNDAILTWVLTQIESCQRSAHSNFSLLSCPPGHFERERPPLFIVGRSHRCNPSEDKSDIGQPHEQEKAGGGALFGAMSHPLGDNESQLHGPGPALPKGGGGGGKTYSGRG